MARLPNLGPTTPRNQTPLTMLHDTQLPRSCDRCHALKERCQRRDGATKCDRCGRLQLVCTSDRALKRPGRPPRPYRHLRRRSPRASPVSTLVSDSSLSSSSSPPSQSPSSRSSSLARTTAYAPPPLYLSPPVLGGSAGLDDDDFRIIERIVSDDFIKQFVHPSFCNAHRESLLSLLVRSRPVVQDSYLACAFSLPCPGEDICKPLDSVRLTKGYQRASKALAALRSQCASRESDVASCLALGVCLLTFAMRFGGNDAFAICSNVLGVVKVTWGLKMEPQADLSFLNRLMLHETSECLMRARVPTLHVSLPRPPGGVDRYLGVSQSILPRFYDLCLLSNEMRYNMGDGASTRDRLEALERAIRDWQPDVPDVRAGDFAPTELSHLTCQASIMQMAALLVLHRLRYPFGTGNAAALALAASILTQLDLTTRMTGRTPRCVDLPLMIACVEIEDGSVRAQHLQKSSSIGIYSHLFLRRVERWIDAVWELRRQRSGMMWYDLGAVTVAPG